MHTALSPITDGILRQFSGVPTWVWYGFAFAYVVGRLLWLIARRQSRKRRYGPTENNIHDLPPPQVIWPSSCATSTSKLPEQPLPLKRKRLMRDDELEFFMCLSRALPNHYVFPQVAFNALLDTEGRLPWTTWRSARNRFDRLVADYVVYSRTTFTVVAVVELDGKSHRNKKDKDEWRDRMLREAGYKAIRFDADNKPTDAQIAARFEALETPTAIGDAKSNLPLG